jgi:hypothetical protein
VSETESTPAPDAPGAAAAAHDPLAVLESLQATLESTARELRKLRAAVRWGKKIIIALAVSFAADILITAGLGYNTIQAHAASDRANATAAQLHASQVAACGVGNQIRARQILPWQKLVQISPPPPGQTPAQRQAREKLISKFLAYVRSVNPTLNCAKLYRQH